MLSPRAIAVEGVGFSPRLVAVRGLWPDVDAGASRAILYVYALTRALAARVTSRTAAGGAESYKLSSAAVGVVTPKTTYGSS
jgi:hypothetical protein